MARYKSEQDSRYDASWSFETDRFFIGFYAEPEEMDPSDTFEFEEDIDAIRSGRVEYFCAAVRVFLKDGWEEVGSDHLGGCAYATVREFWEWHTTKAARDYKATLPAGTVVCDYFPVMVRQAVKAARATVAAFADIASTLRPDA
jgi:hypothetical protein